MVHLTYLAIASVLGSAASALALPAPAVTPAASLEKRTSCTFSGSDGAASASESKKDCATIVISAVVVPSGTTLDLTDLADNTVVTFEGETTFGYAEWDGPLVSVSGSSITVKGASGSSLNGDGSRWWDGEGSNGGTTKPKFFYAHDIITGSISDLTIVNSPVQVFSIDGSSDLVLDSITIDNSDGDSGSLAANTDGFDIGDSTSITISNANVKNQDDCMAINSGTDITFTGGTCSGSHGLSIGSVGGRDDNTVENVLITASTVTDSANGIRIKTISGDTGTVKNITFSDITLSGITGYGIVIEQDYENGSPTGTPTTGVPITDVTVDGITGTCSGDDAVPIYILCGSGSCSDWTWESVDITGGTDSDDCENVPSGASCTS